MVFFRGAEKKLKAAKALKEKGDTPEALLQSIKENEKAEAERKAAEERERAEKEEKARIEAEKKEAERIAAEKAEEEARVEAERKAEEEAVEKDAELKEDKKKPQLKDVVKAIYEKGKSAASRLYKMAFFDVAKTPDFMKKLGLTGDRFTIKYGVLSRHAGKDDSHSLTEKQWEELPDALQKPFAITRFGGKDKGYRLYTTMKNEKGETIVVGVDVKNVGRDMEVNAISTIFGRRGDAKKTQKEDVLYTAENITPEQRSLLGQPNSDQYTGVRERNVSTDKGSEKAEKKQEKQSVFDKAKEIADKEEKKRKAEAEDDSVLGQATRAVGKKKKVDPFKYTASKIISHPVLRGVHYANGYAYASDEYILFKEKADYPKEWEGTTRDKDGNLVDGKYPDAEKAIHGFVYIPDKEVESLPSKEVLDFAIAASKKLKGKAIPVAIDGIFFNAVNLKKFLEAVASKGMDKVVYRHPMLYATNGKDEIITMPIVNPLEGALDIADKMESAGLPKEQIDAWKAHIEAADKKKSFDDFKKAVENAKKEGVRPTEAEKPKEQPLTEAERKDAEEVAGALGYRVEWVDTMEENGTIDADKKVIRIAKDAENPLVQVLGHEVAHGVKRMDGGKFRALQKAAKEVVGEKEWNERIEKKRKLNAYAEGKLAEEVTCDIVGEALNNKDALKRLAESLRGEKGILARLRDAVAKMVEYFKNRGDKEGVRRMKAADKLLAEFESALKEDVAPEQVKPEGVDRSVREGKKDDKTLYGVHNISEDKLRKAMKLGGLANPSMAVVDKDKGTHEGFGAISLIAPSSLVDKQTGRTAGSWITDAYTQRYPSVERVMSDKGYEKFKSWVDGLDFAEKEKKEIMRQATDAMESDKDLAWELMYLREKGVDVKGYTSEVDYPWGKIIEEYPSVEDIIKAMDHNAELKEKVTKLAKVEITGPVYKAVSADVRRRFKEETGENASPLNPIIRKRTADIFNRDYVPKLLDENGLPKESDVREIIGQMVEKYNATKKVDFNKSKSNASTYVHNNGLYADYLKWQEDKLEEFGTQGRIFRGYKNDGTRKYVPETLSNVSKAMKEESQGQTNGSEYTSFGSFIAKLAPRVDSKEEMRGNKSRLDADEAKQEFYKKWESTYYDLAKELYDDVYYGEERLHDIVLQSDPKRYAKKEYGITLSPSFLKRLEALKKAIREDLKSAYFETKFERPVMFNEFAAAVVPKGIGDDVRKGLEDAGLVLYEYDPAKKGDRERAVNEASAPDGIRFNRSEKTELTEEERELRDNLVERMRKGGLDVVTDSEEMQRVIDTENERTRNKRSKKSEAARKRDEALYAVDWSTAFVSGKSREEATEIRRERGRKFKEETKELYGRVLSGNFDDVTLRLIDEFIDKSTPNNPYERPISKRLPTRALQKMRGGERTGSVDALFSRICESAVGKDGKALPRAERKRAIEEKKKELLKKWAIATGNWHTDVSDFSDGKEPIGSGTDSDVYLSKDGKSVIKVSKGKPYGKRFRPDVDNVALFNTVFPGSRYTIEGYGEIDGKFVRFLKQPFVDFSDSTPLTEGERVAYMEKLGFKPINKENTAFSNGEIIASDLQKSNIVKDKQGNVRVIDADMKLHTKDFGGKFSYPDAETDTRTDGMQRFLRTAGGEVYGLVKDGRIYLDPKVATSETAVHEYTHLWGDMLRRKDAEQWSRTVKELKNSVLWEEVKELYPELKTDDEIADEVLSTFSGRRGAERLREEARRVADGDGGVFTKAKAIETLERVKEAIARFWEGVAKMFGINRYRSAEELADMAMRDLINGVKPTSRTFTFDNFYKDTKAVFEGTERPKGKPDYTSYSGSEYWYGEDKGGKYVVRGSDHWSGEFKVKDGERTNVGRNHYSEITEDGMLPIGAQGSLKFGWEKGLSKPVGSGISAAIDRRGSGDSNNIASCYWYIDNAKGKDNKGFTYGKAYLSEFEDKERRRDIPGDDWRDIQGLEGGTRAMAVKKANDRFNEELEMQVKGELEEGHVYKLGMPSEILLSTGVPNLPIELSAKQLSKKAADRGHMFDVKDIANLPQAIQAPIAVFEYGNKDKSQNLIVEIERDGKKFVVGIHFNQNRRGIVVNDIRGLFNKDSHEWLNWISQGKLLYADKEKIQALIDKQRTNLAEVNYLNLDDVAKKVKDFENPKLFGEEIIDDGKKGSDSIDRSVRENPKNEDKPRLSRKPGESIFDYASRVSESVDRSVRERVSARDEYEKKVKSKGFQTKEALQNSMLGLQEFMFAIDHASGNRRYIEDIPDFENPILGENRLSSVNKEEMHQVAKTQFKPLMSAVAKLSGNGKESGELYDYMFAKHGLERDAVMRQREAQKEFDKYKKANPKGTKTIGDFVASLEGKDYAGLTALTAEDGRVKSIQSQIDAIDEQMKATDVQLLLHYLGGQKKRLKVDLLNAARDAADDIRKAFESNPSHDRSDINELWKRVNEVNGNTLRKLYESGLLTKEAYDDISSMYTNYIPMRGFDQTTSADAYAYLTHGDSAFNAPIKTAKGRSSKADNPIAYMQAMAESAIMQGNRNVLVKQKMLNFVRNHPSDLASVSDVWLQYDSVADEWKPFYAFGRESKGVKRQEHGDIFVEYQRCKMHGTYSFWGNQPNSSDLIPRAIIIGKATI